MDNAKVSDPRTEGFQIIFSNSFNVLEVGKEYIKILQIFHPSLPLTAHNWQK